MKYTYSTVDLLDIVNELKERIIGYRVNQIYDIDHKTYLIKLQKPESKKVLLIESAARIHLTEYEWPKSPAPSSFTMKLRKHIRNKRLESIEQLGVDRVVDIKFGTDEFAYHMIIELYDRGNIALTDQNYLILNVLRPRVDGEITKIIVNQTYQINSARQPKEPPTLEIVRNALENAKDGTPLKKIFNPLLDCGGSVLEHELGNIGLPVGPKKGKNINIDSDLENIHKALQNAQSSINNSVSSEGYIIKKSEEKTKSDGTMETIYLYQEFHSRPYFQHKDLEIDKFESFNAACDEFFSKIESNQIDKKALQKEKEALKKLENVKKDHQKRLKDLQDAQENDRRKGELIELNHKLVENCIKVVRSAIANQIDWKEIDEMVDEAQSKGDANALAIRKLDLRKNSMTLLLSDPYEYDENDLLLDSDEEREEGADSSVMRPMTIEIDLDQSAFVNARHYFDKKRQAAKKEKKTIDASFKAIKSAEKKTKQTLKEVNAITNINKARKVHWFEKFFWFISSENYLILGGRDSQQNELVVKKHLKPSDIYVHADLHGASSVIIKNPDGNPVPPVTLHEAGIMALCYSKAWEEKVVTSAWWVWGNQVSKAAPTGEYLTTGAFMVRGKKNFLPPSHLVYGFGFMFRLEESSVSRHKGERKARQLSVSESTDISENDDEDILNNEDNDSSDEETKDIKANGINKVETIESSSKSEVKVDNANEQESDIRKKIDEDINVNNINGDDNNESSSEEKFENNIKENEFKTAKKIDDANNSVYENALEEKQLADSVKEMSVKSETNPEEESKDDESEEETVEFPDTVLEMQHLKDGQYALVAKGPVDKNKSTNVSDSISSKKHNSTKDKKKVEFNTQGLPDKKSEQSSGKKETEGGADKKSEHSSGKKLTKAKLKKMRKYQDQDEEEKELRMKLLQSAGVHKPLKGRAAKKAKEQEKEAAKQAMREKKLEQMRQKASQPKADVQEEEEDDSAQVADDIAIIDSLTAIPMDEDEILYAIPVCAPYTTMSNYRFKVKLTPGTGKKGKACKTALTYFLADKSMSQRDKDLLRSMKDHDLAKNLPGKVKVSGPNIHKAKK